MLGWKTGGSRMKFDQASCLGFLIGYFILSKLLFGILAGDLRIIFNTSIDGIIGLLFAIGMGLWFGRLEK